MCRLSEFLVYFEYIKVNFSIFLCCFSDFRLRFQILLKMMIIGVIEGKRIFLLWSPFSSTLKNYCNLQLRTSFSFIISSPDLSLMNDVMGMNHVFCLLTFSLRCSCLSAFSSFFGNSPSFRLTYWFTLVFHWICAR